MSIKCKQFDGTLASYLEIFEWLKSCGDTYALAGEVTYETPNMYVRGSGLEREVCAGDFIFYGDKGALVVGPKHYGPEHMQVLSLLTDLQTRLNRIESDTKHFRTTWRIIVCWSTTPWPLDEQGNPTNEDMVLERDLTEKDARERISALTRTGCFYQGHWYQIALLLDGNEIVEQFGLLIP